VSDKTDHEAIEKKAEEILAALKKQKPPKVILPESKIKIEKEETGGWSVKLAEYASISVELWFDHLLNGTKRSEKRKFWYGFIEDDAIGFDMLAAALPANAQPLGGQCSDNEVKNSRKLKRQYFRNPPTTGVPVLERYERTRLSFYGKFATGDMVPKRAAEFILRVAVHFPSALTKIATSEGDRAHVETERYMRDQDIVWQRKEFDKYKCQVCDLSFREIYGSLGDGFAEVHHLLPLAQANERVTRLRDLVTVCANCHRMLHRMKDGGRKDVRVLRQTVESARRDAQSAPRSRRQ